jgi:hypothetical protein
LWLIEKHNLIKSGCFLMIQDEIAVVDSVVGVKRVRPAEVALTFDFDGHSWRFSNGKLSVGKPEECFNSYYRCRYHHNGCMARMSISWNMNTETQCLMFSTPFYVKEGNAVHDHTAVTAVKTLKDDSFSSDPTPHPTLIQFINVIREISSEKVVELELISKGRRSAPVHQPPRVEALPRDYLDWLKTIA